MMKGVNLRFTATNAASPAMRQVQRDLGGVQRTVRQGAPLMRSWNAGLNSNRRAVQQLGFQMSDFAIQISGGQSAMLAFTQQGGQMLQFFGPAGAIMAAFLAIFGSLAIAFTKSGKALSDLFPLMGVLQDDFRAIGSTLNTVKELLIDFTNLFVNNLDVIIIAAAMVAGFFATKWVAAFVAARTAVLAAGLQTTVMAGQTLGMMYAANAAAIATRVWAGALALLRTALIYLGIPALIIGIAYLAERFIAMSRVVGGAGEMFKLLGDLVAEVFRRMYDHILLMQIRAVATWARLKAAIIGYLADIIEWLPAGFINPIIGAYVGAFKAVQAVWQALPDVFRRVGALAINGLIEILETGVNGIVGALNGILEGVGLDPIDLIDLSAWKAAEGEAVNVAGRAADAFRGAMGQDYAGPMVDGLRTAADEASAMADQFDGLGDMMADVVNRPISAWERLTQVWRDARDAQIDVRDWFGGGAGTDADGGGSGGSPGGGAGADDVETFADRWEKAMERVTGGIKKFSDSIADAIVNSKSLADVFSNALKKMASNLISSGIQGLIMQTFGKLFGAMGTGGMGSFGSILFGGMFGGSFEKGGPTWRGTNTGGIDGRGGRAAVLHPNEEVIPAGGSAGGAGGAVRVYVDDDMRLRAVFQQHIESNMQQMNKSLPARVGQISNDRYRRY